MDFPEIKIYLIGKSVADRDEIKRWQEEMGVKNVTFPPAESTDAEAIIGGAAKRCYKSFEVGLNPNITKVRKDLVEFFDNILKSGHGSVLEHVVWNFAIENVTRVFTGELNRHRAGCAISEGSMRYILFEEDGVSFWMPLSVRHQSGDSPELEQKKKETQELIRSHIKNTEWAYKELCQIWDVKNVPDFDTKKKLTSMFRRIIPMGACTGGTWSFNIRAMRHIITQRASVHAEEEIAHVFSLIAQKLVEVEPNLFGDFTDENGHWTPKYVKV